MHYATHGHTAAEIIFTRVDSNKENVGLTNFKGNYPTKCETEIAKYYLTEEELNTLNRMVSAYLDVAEINALDRHPMTMQDWVNELDSFLKMTRKDILKGSGCISHEKALEKAHKEYDKYILKIKNKSDTMILHEISKIKFQSFSDLKEFLSLNKDNKNQSISMSASKYKKRLHYLIEQMNFINELHNNGIVKEDELLSVG